MQRASAHIEHICETTPEQLALIDHRAHLREERQDEPGMIGGMLDIHTDGTCMITPQKRADILACSRHSHVLKRAPD
jgi:hypothetical protein